MRTRARLGSTPLRGATRTRRFLGVSALGLVVTATGACSSDFDTSRTIPERGTLGEEVFGVLCDRVGAQAFHEDLTGDSFRRVCHKVDGRYEDKVDQTKLPATAEGAVDKGGNVVPVARQQADRAYAVARVETLARRRSELIAALDATFPNRKVLVKDNKNADPARSCGTPAGDRERKLSEELADMLGRFQALYSDGTVPQSTQSLGRVMNAFRASPEAQKAWARLDARKGYRPMDVALGAARPVVAYPGLRELTNSALRLLSSDAEPFAIDPPRDSSGRRVPVAGSAYSAFSKVLEVSHEELRTLTADPPVAPLVETRDAAGRPMLSRPRTKLEAIDALLYAQDAAFGTGNPRYIVKRDARGYAAVTLDNGKVPAPFLDADGDKLPDVDPLGQFVLAPNAKVDTPFFTSDTLGGTFDPLGRALGPGGKLVYDYIDVAHTFGAQVIADLRPLVVADPQKKHETLMYALAGAPVLAGAREKATQKYAPDPSLVTVWKSTHAANEPPPPDLATRPVTVEYDAFKSDASPLLDLVYAFGQLLGDRTMDDTLAASRTLVTDHTPTLARVAGNALAARDIADKHPEAQIPAKSTLWDELIDVFVVVAQEPGMLEDVLAAVANDDTAALGGAFGSYMAFKDRVSYDRANLNGPAKNFTTNKVGDPMKTPVDRGQPATGKNRSAFHGFLQAIHDVNGVTLCNREGAIVHARGVPLLGEGDICEGSLALCSLFGTRPFHECEVFKVENLAKFYLQSIIGKARLYFRPKVLRDGILGIGAAKVDTIQQSSGILGFWDDKNSYNFRPQPRFLNRLVFFDLQNDSQNPTHDFIADLQGDKVGTAACQERIIDDPVPDAADVSPDRKVRGLRTCQDGEWFFQRDQDAVMVWEQFGFYKAITPLLQAFGNHGREDLFLQLIEVLHKHWSDDKASAAECKLTPSASCSKDGAVRYEALLAEVMATDLFPALTQLSKTLQTIKVPHCTALDPKTKQCTTFTQVSGLTVMAEAARSMIDPNRAKATGLKDRAGKVTALRNDGGTNPQVTPLYLILQALNGIDQSFGAYIQGSGGDTSRRDQWRMARSQLVDQFLDVVGKGTATASFKNAAVPKIAPLVLDVLRGQLLAHCPDAGVTPYPRCAWAKDELTQSATKVVHGPSFAAVVDLLDTLRKDDKARRQIQELASYLLDAASQNDALPAVLSAMHDGTQALKDETNLVPLLNVLAEGMRASVRDKDGTIVQKGLADAQLALLSRVIGRAYDKDGKEDCSRELDPNEVLELSLQNLVTPMPGANGRPGRTPLEVVIDVVADVNRAAPAPENRAKLDDKDYAHIADEVSDFLMNKERGLEQFYEIVRQGTVKE